MRDEITLSLTTYKHLLDRLNLGEPHPTLVGGERWYPPDERAGLRAAADAELDRLGLLRGGRLDDGFLETLHLLQRPSVEYYTWAKFADGHTATVRTAGNGCTAVVAVANQHTLHLSPSQPDTLAADLVERLPEAPPAAGLSSTSCSEADYEALLAGASVPPGSSATSAKYILRWMRLPRQHGGRLYAAVRGAAGRRRTMKPPFWIDVEAGRFLLSLDATGWLSIAAAGTREVAARLEALAAGLHGR
ncbi:ESX secretion-associated protein EspG [Amycolatopsis suaedae]|uniref:ESX secretion-associated protein EspG n=1 Tax=Amycolatopsis suaedae TaxID=2510978 RepID=A0A4Q7JDD0_9PSEU|nr:ESX secretion-associated protein EspG [Amycolatopsis suaedae]RZQ65399.1 ESX secretion-associated protein EspG [Amycolatopsis suaedae]